MVLIGGYRAFRCISRGLELGVAVMAWGGEVLVYPIEISSHCVGVSSVLSMLLTDRSMRAGALS